MIFEVILRKSEGRIQGAEGKENVKLFIAKSHKSKNGWVTL